MELVPFGALSNALKKRQTGLFTPMYEWPGTQSEFQDLIREWLSDVSDSIWPHWDGKTWSGAASKNKESTTHDELKVAVALYHGASGTADILTEVPDIPPAEDGNDRSQEWHYNVEDALVLDSKFAHIDLPEGQEPSLNYRASKTIGSNFLLYDESFDIEEFENLFWGRMRGLQPPLFDIKQFFQRPRPWTAAAMFGLSDFRWTTANGFTHTGVHPSILSGHCVQGILGGCSVFEAQLDQAKSTGVGLSESRINAIQKYMVDWGDRRVFAGVHYMTDNIASWTLARRLIPHLFRNSQEVENFAVTAITRHSRVFRDILAGLAKTHPEAIKMLLRDFPEGAAVS